ncbi:UDP-2,4-diacetamido-2,4,6-trideoxy-beta-L-altropyranose hydrolase [Tannerella forsythia]|uniref:UDP-2,4-diacetamido-2,4, 6-trideoxy-beta-L-altropyranose hydrolase n=1 Tax=Tannerella forsythia TaxID=28112 RepID=A0A3P1XSE0_TANFO|nr:UDP-2,4-diacetamido-2,4,6-trideoxy-beta-L-altropyranose hydrolase [Tannerella forsythia]RRD61421.1 UDP-2,4-diacetamido-2,4,6-trideoxy-beta-L-altropyranose hydrolase [Tannerella forsythia]
MKKQKILFRADAGPEIGYGHFMRTLALADMLKDDFDCTFVTQTPTVFQRQEVIKICNLIELPPDKSKFSLFLEMLSGDEIVVLDNYFYSTNYQKKIKSIGCKLVCIDDTSDKHYVADIVINHGTNRTDQFDVESYTKLCVGLDWALLRKPFFEAAKINREQPRTIKNIALCFGGTDIHNFTDKYIRYLNNMSSVKQIDVIVGSHYQSTLLKTERRNVLFHKDISANMLAKLFLNSDLAIVSASTVSIEALFCGAEVAIGWYTKNQKNLYDFLIFNNYALGLGFFFSKELSIQGQSRNKRVAISQNIAKRYVSIFQSILLS